jgi:hypothetical protein
VLLILENVIEDVHHALVQLIVIVLVILVRIMLSIILQLEVAYAVLTGLDMTAYYGRESVIVSAKVATIR